MPRIGSWMLMKDGNVLKEGFETRGDAEMFRDNHAEFAECRVVQFANPYPDKARGEVVHSTTPARDVGLYLIDHDGGLAEDYTLYGCVLVYDLKRKHAGMLMPVEEDDSIKLKSLAPEEVADKLGEVVANEAKNRWILKGKIAGLEEQLSELREALKEAEEE